MKEKDEEFEKEIEELKEESEKYNEMISSNNEANNIDSELEEFKEETEKYNEMLEESAAENEYDDSLNDDEEESLENGEEKIDEKTEEENNPHEKKPQEIKKRQKKIIAILSCLIVLTLIIGGYACIRLNKPKHTKYNMEDDYSEEDKKIAGLIEDEETDNTKSAINKVKEKQEEKIKNYNNTKSYNEYQKLSDEEKQKIEDIPVKEDKSIELLDDIKEEIEIIEEIPAKYDLRDHIDLVVDTQGQYGLCWDFATLESMETNYQLHNKKPINLSEIAVDYLTSEKLFGRREIHEGGNFEYMLNEGSIKGTRKEKENEYRDFSDDEVWNLLDGKDNYYITDYVSFPSVYKEDGKANISDEELNEFRKLVKSHIMQNGSLYTSIKSIGNNPFNKNWYNTKALSDHAVSIVGWDDNYPKENFVDLSETNSNKHPIHDGAYIIKNSWGTELGDKGYYYISYDDALIESSLRGVLSVSEKDKVYLSDMPDFLTNLLKTNYKYQIKKDDKGDYVFNSTLKFINNIEFNSDTQLAPGEFTRIIELLPNLSSINIHDVSIDDISPLENSHNLQSIIIKNVTTIKDYSVLGRIQSLNTLYLQNDGITDISFVSSISKISIINFANNNIHDISPLANLPELSYVVLNNNQIKDVSVLKNNKKISFLDLSGNIGISGYGELSDIYSLNISNCELSTPEEIKVADTKTYFYLIMSNNSFTNIPKIIKNTAEQEEDFNIFIDAENNNISTLSDLNKDYTYQSINLKDNKVSNISELNDFKFYFVNLANNNISDTSSFSNTRIRELDLSNNKDIVVTKQLNSVFKLNLNDCDINSLKDISILDNVERLLLNSNNITNLDGLASLKKLKSLSLDNNKIKSLEKIEDSKIEELTLINNDIQDIGDLSSLNNLTSLNLSKNKNINDYSFFSKLKKLEYLYLDDVGSINMNDFSNTIEDVSVSFQNDTIKGNLTGNFTIINLYGSKFEDFSIFDIKFIYLNLTKTTGNIDIDKIFSNSKKLSSNRYVSIDLGDQSFNMDNIKTLENIKDNCTINLSNVKIHKKVKFSNNKYSLDDLPFRKTLINSYAYGNIVNAYYNDDFSSIYRIDDSKNIKIDYNHKKQHYALSNSNLILESDD